MQRRKRNIMFRRGVEKSAQEGCLRCSLGVNSRKLVYPGSIDESIVAILAACVCVRVTPPLGIPSTITAWIGLKFCTDIHSSPRMSATDYSATSRSTFSLSCETSTCFLIWYRFMVQTIYPTDDDTTNCNNFGDPNCDTFHIEESSGQNLN